MNSGIQDGERTLETKVGQDVQQESVEEGHSVHSQREAGAITRVGVQHCSGVRGSEEFLAQGKGNQSWELTRTKKGRRTHLLLNCYSSTIINSFQWLDAEVRKRPGANGFASMSCEKEISTANSSEWNGNVTNSLRHTTSLWNDMRNGASTQERNQKMKENELMREMPLARERGSQKKKTIGGKGAKPKEWL